MSKPRSRDALPGKRNGEPELSLHARGGATGEFVFNVAARGWLAVCAVGLVLIVLALCVMLVRSGDAGPVASLGPRRSHTPSMR